MRLKKEERYQIKLIRLAKAISRSKLFDAAYDYKPWTQYLGHSFRVHSSPDCNFVVYTHGLKTAEDCYKWTFAECKEKGVIQ